MALAAGLRAVEEMVAAGRAVVVTAVARVEAAKATATRAAVARAVVVVVAAEMAPVGRACLRAFWLARRARPTRELYLVADDSPESSRDWPSMRISSSETSPILCEPAHGCGRRARTPHSVAKVANNPKVEPDSV